MAVSNSRCSVDSIFFLIKLVTVWLPTHGSSTVPLGLWPVRPGARSSDGWRRAMPPLAKLARPFRVSRRPAISKRLRVLERAGLVMRKRQGRISRCRLDAAAMRNAAEWVERCRAFWEGGLDRLARYIEETKA